MVRLRDDAKRAAVVFFGGPDPITGTLRTPEECYRLFVEHSWGRRDDEHTSGSPRYEPKVDPWVSFPGVSALPKNWYGLLWWEGREKGIPDPTLPRWNRLRSLYARWRIWRGQPYRTRIHRFLQRGDALGRHTSTPI